MARLDGFGSFLPHVPGLALVRSTRARPLVPSFDLGGMRYDRFGGPILVWVSNYVSVAT